MQKSQHSDNKRMIIGRYEFTAHYKTNNCYENKNVKTHYIEKGKPLCQVKVKGKLKLLGEGKPTCKNCLNFRRRNK